MRQVTLPGLAVVVGVSLLLAACGGATSGAPGDVVAGEVEADERASQGAEPGDMGVADPPRSPHLQDGPGPGVGEVSPDARPLGSPCDADSECRSAVCHRIPFLGGRCSECDADSLCESGGCTPWSPWGNAGHVWSTCNEGRIGEVCADGSECADGRVCALVLDLPGFVRIRACSECLRNEDCGEFNGEEQVCAPIVDLVDHLAQRECRPLYSLGLHEYCDPEGEGRRLCVSDICRPVPLTGLADGQVQLGACSECLSENECWGAPCIPPSLDYTTGELFGAYCDYNATRE